ncbi:MAG: hypothetical protein JO257_35105 [Deltaproteobacteria bacterium]|nr:hypothetical protein [Deltaproteobacteria bacterium]
MWRFVLEIALGLSIGVNVYMLTRHEAPSTPTIVTVTEPRVCPPPADAAAVVASPPSVGSGCPPAPKADCVAAAKADCSAVEKKLAETEAALEEHLPPDQRYKHAARSIASEARARAVLDPVFARISKVPHSYDVECHGSVCKLDVVDPALSMSSWMDAVQREGGFAGWSFSRETFAILGTPDESAKSLLMAAIGRALEPDGGLAACAGAEKPAGTLTLGIALDAATQRLVLTTSGSLASDKLGQCVKSHVQAALDAVKLPDGVGSFATDIPLLR